MKRTGSAKASARAFEPDDPTGDGFRFRIERDRFHGISPGSSWCCPPRARLGSRSGLRRDRRSRGDPARVAVDETTDSVTEKSQSFEGEQRVKCQSHRWRMHLQGQSASQCGDPAREHRYPGSPWLQRAAGRPRLWCRRGQEGTQSARRCPARCRARRHRIPGTPKNDTLTGPPRSTTADKILGAC